MKSISVIFFFFWHLLSVACAYTTHHNGFNFRYRRRIKSTLPVSIQSRLHSANVLNTTGLNDLSQIHVSDNSQRSEQHQTTRIRTLLVDNFDSYTFNIWQAIAEDNNHKPVVIYNNDYQFLNYLKSSQFVDFDNIVLSPGPGTVINPIDFGICKDLIEISPIPILGVCLGHQGISHVYGGKIAKAPEPIHGRLWSIQHTGEDLFQGVEQDTQVVRYHSLIAVNNATHPLPSCLQVTAWTDDGLVMGLQHKDRPIYGVQFHPESIGTQCGKKLFANFQNITRKYRDASESHSDNNISSRSRSRSSNRSRLKQADQLKPKPTILFNSINLLQQQKQSVSSSISNEPVPTITRKKRHVYISTKHIASIILTNTTTATTNPPFLQYLFERLFLNKTSSFWLDSPTTNIDTATIFNTTSSLSSSTDNTASSSVSASYSFMGCLDTPSSYVIEYRGNNTLDIKYPHQSTVTTSTLPSSLPSSSAVNALRQQQYQRREHKNIFEYLKEQINDQQSNVDVIIHHKQEQQQSQSQQQDFTQQSHPSSLSPSVLIKEVAKGRVLFGYIGYEARHDASYILESSSSGSSSSSSSASVVSSRNGDALATDGDDSSRNMFNMSSTKNSAFSSYLHNSTDSKHNTDISDKSGSRSTVVVDSTTAVGSMPTSAFFVPSRYIMYDHTNNLLHIVSVKDGDAADSNIDSEIDIVDDTCNSKGVGGNINNSDSNNENGNNSELSELESQVHRVITDYKAIYHLPSQQSTDHHANDNNSRRSVTTDDANNHSNNNCNNNDHKSSHNLPYKNKMLISSQSKEQYSRNIEKCLQHIEEGDSYELCLTMKFTGPYNTHHNTPSNSSSDRHDNQTYESSIHDTATTTATNNNNSHNNNNADIIDNIHDSKTYSASSSPSSSSSSSSSSSPFSLYKTLRRLNPAPYSCFLQYNPPSSFLEKVPNTIIDRINHSKSDDTSCQSNTSTSTSTSSSYSSSSSFSVCCSSPERYLKITADGIIESKPIKGTARRNLFNSTHDSEIAIQLQQDEKSRAENLMIVDLVRNDLGRVCEIGSVHVPDLMAIETYTTVHQLVSTIRGKLSPSLNTADALVATFPGGSMTGAPKLRTMELIHVLEQGQPRGIYSGTIGYIALDGTADLNIVIRTALITKDTITIGAGGAIVAMSDPQKEVAEVLLKARAVSSAIGYDLSFAPEQSILLTSDSSGNNDDDETKIK